MTNADEVLLALTAWRENRGGGQDGMHSVINVINVIMNRSRIRNTAPYTECVRPLQFSSLTAKGDPELILFPSVTDPQWLLAQQLATAAVSSQLEDLTDGATLYYAKTMKTPPSWANPAKQTADIAGQLFFRA